MRVVNEFMALVDNRKESMTDDMYLNICKDIQYTHTLITQVSR